VPWDMFSGVGGAAGGQSTSGGSGGAAGSNPDSDASADRGGDAGSGEPSSLDATSADGAGAADGAPDARIDADVRTDARIDAADVSVMPEVGVPDVSVEGASDASRDARPDADGTVNDARRDVADAVVDKGIPPDAPKWAGKSCVDHCNADNDCMPVLPVGDFECDLATHRCVTCRNDLACVAASSGWIIGCTKSSDCVSIGNVCINVNGAGKCAFTVATCGGIFPDDIPAQEFPTGTAVTVCGIASSECHAGRCVDRCSPIHTCTPEQGGSACNESTGRCECNDDNDCAGGVGVSRCNTVTRQCECAGSADCVGVQDVDICVDGKCGCSTVDICKPDFTGTTLSCE